MSSSSSPWKNKKAQLLHNLWIDSPAFISFCVLASVPINSFTYTWVSVFPHCYAYSCQRFPFTMFTTISFSPFLCVQPSAFPLFMCTAISFSPLLCVQPSAFPLRYVYSHQLFPFAMFTAISFSPFLSPSLSPLMMSAWSPFPSLLVFLPEKKDIYARKKLINLLIIYI